MTEEMSKKLEDEFTAKLMSLIKILLQKNAKLALRKRNTTISETASLELLVLRK